jgi:VWFA-related protein
MNGGVIAMRRLVVVLLTLLPAGAAQAQPKTPAREGPPQFRTAAEVVVLDVVVRDKKGRTIRDLQPSEIQVLEDGVPQEPVSFRLRAAGDQPWAAAAGAPGAAAPAAKAGEVVHANLVTLVFDQLGPAGRPVARKAGLALARLADRPDLLVSVFQIRESLRLVQQFTTDRDLIEQGVEKATGDVATQYTEATELLAEAVAKDREAQQRLESAMGSVTGPQGVAFIARLGRDADMARMAVDALRLTQSLQREQQGHSSLYSLLALSRQQQRLAGRKTILFFSEGLQVPPQLEHVLRTAISEANRANVSVYSVDARGLGDSRTFDSTRQTLQEAALASQRTMSRQGAGPVTREEVLAPETAENALRMDVQGALADLAAGTGGTLIANTNDVARGIERAVGDLQGYYELVYAPTNPAYDGRFRRIEVRVSRKDAVVQARSGYFALPPGEGTATFPFEVELLRVLRRHPPPEEFPVNARLFRFGPEASGLRHTLVVELPLAGIDFQPDDRGETDRAHFSILCVVRDQTGAAVEKFSEDSPLFLPRAQRAELKRGNAVFLRSFVAPAGRYGVEIAVVDQLARRYSIRKEALDVRPPATGLALSDLALVKRTEAVPAGALASEDPFRQGSSRVVPHLAEPHLGPGESLSLFLVAYPKKDAARADLLLELLRDGQLVGQSLSELPAPDGSGRVPFLTQLSLRDFAPGRYEVRVLFKQGGLVAHQKTSFVLDGTSS